MRFRYSEWDGEAFQSQDRLDFSNQFMDFVLEYGDQALDALRRMEQDPEQNELLKKLLDDGLLEKMGARWRLTPRAVDAMQRKALMEVFRHLRKGRQEGHPSSEPGARGERTESNRPWQFGDPVSELDLAATLRQTLQRRGPGLPLRINERDFTVYQSEQSASCSTVILLDMSGSMARYRRFYHAKKCAMALHALIRQSFPLDTVDLVGFYSSAQLIPEHKLPLLSPKPVTIHDYEVRLRVPMNQADEAPQHFTNLHMGLMLARQLLMRRGGDNKQIFIITDGHPTAHVQGDDLVLLYPPEQLTALTTLKEALRISRQGVRLATFALADDYEYMDWVSFVDQMTRLTRGVAFYCASGELAQCIMESYLSGRKQRAYLA